MDIYLKLSLHPRGTQFLQIETSTETFMKKKQNLTVLLIIVMRGKEEAISHDQIQTALSNK